MSRFIASVALALGLTLLAGCGQCGSKDDAAPEETTTATIAATPPTTPDVVAAAPVKPSEADCQAACDHAKAVTTPTLTPTMKRKLRVAILTALGEPCVKSCQQHATTDGLACLRAATTVDALADCPK